MTKRNFSFLILIVICTLIGCKDNDTKSDADGISNSTTSNTTNYPLIYDKGFGPEQIKKLNTSAKSILDHRKNLATSSFGSLIDGVWEYEFVYQNGKMSEKGDYAGYWLDFINNESYSYGYKATVAGKGQFHYGIDSDLLLLVNDDERIKPVQIKAKYSGDMLVLSGDPEYKDNGFQSKLTRVEQRPR
jgi:hypothetical protein